MKYLVGNPMITITSDLLHNRDHFGNKIWYDFEDPKIKALKGTFHVYKQLVPSSFPGSWDFQKMWQTFSGEKGPRVLTPGQAVAYNLGLKITPMTMEGIRMALSGLRD